MVYPPLHLLEFFKRAVAFVFILPGQQLPDHAGDAREPHPYLYELAEPGVQDIRQGEEPEGVACGGGVKHNDIILPGVHVLQKGVKARYLVYAWGHACNVKDLVQAEAPEGADLLYLRGEHLLVFPHGELGVYLQCIEVPGNIPYLAAYPGVK